MEIKKKEIYILLNLIKKIMEDRGEKGYDLLFLEMYCGTSKEERTIKVVRDILEREIEVIDFSFFFKKEKSIILVASFKNLFGLQTNLKKLVEHRLFCCFFITKLEKPEVKILEGETYKVLELIDYLLREKNLNLTYWIYRYSTENFSLAGELDDFINTLDSDVAQYSYVENKFSLLENRKKTVNAKILLANVIISYLKMNNLVFCDNFLLRRVDGFNLSWEYFAKKESLSLIHMISFFKTNLNHYAEYIDFDLLLVADYAVYLELINNVSHYFDTIVIKPGVEFLDGYLDESGIFFPTGEIPAGTNVLFSVKKEKSYDIQENKLLLLSAKNKVASLLKY